MVRFLHCEQRFRSLSTSNNSLLSGGVGVAPPIHQRLPLFQSSPLSTMATAITKSPLPALDSHRIQELRMRQAVDLSRVSTAYDKILRAERHAVQQKAEDNIMTARVAGYLLLEFCAQPDIFGDSPYTSLVSSVISPPWGAGDNEHDVIYHVGKRCRDKFIRLCAFHHILSQFDTHSQVRKHIYMYESSSYWERAVQFLPSLFSGDMKLDDMIQVYMEEPGSNYMTLKRKVREPCASLLHCC